MITPKFTIRQDDEFIYIDVRIGHVRFSADHLEMVVEDNLFVLSLPPYYLRLRFSHSLIDDERSSARYDSANEEIKIKVGKLNLGETFEDLDLNAKLLARSNEIVKDDTELIREVGLKPSSGPLIQEMDVDQNLDKAIDEAEAFNWEIQQSVAEDEVATVKYGFNNQYDGIIGLSLSNGNDINELSDPERMTLDQRIMERLIRENIKFDHEYYAADYIMEKYPDEQDDKRFKELIEWKSPITTTFLKFNKKQQLLKKEGQPVENFPKFEFTKEEEELMLNLPKRTYLVEKPVYWHVTLLSVLFGYCFDLRENEGDKNSESAWTVGKIVPQISTLDAKIVPEQDQNLIKSAVITGIRRALSYPLHRNYNLVMKCWEDVYYNLRCGKRYVLRSLLALRELFRFHDIYYVYCKILLDDLISWFINDVSDNLIRNLAHELRQVTSSLQKSEIVFEKVIEPEANAVEEMVVLDLQEIEQMADEMYLEQFK